MDFKKVDWMHVLGWGTAGVIGVGVLATLPVSAPIIGVASALGLTVSAGTAGLAAAGISAISQAKGAGNAQK